MNTPLIVPPAIFEQIKNDPRWAARCADGRILPNHPLPTAPRKNP